MIRDAVTCDVDDCMAAYLEPDANPYAVPGQDGEPTRGEDVLEFEQLIELAGWISRPAVLKLPGQKRDVTGHICPACIQNRGPVLELGECPRCMGRTVDRADGATCMYCGHTQPHPAGEDW